MRDLSTSLFAGLAFLSLAACGEEPPSPEMVEAGRVAFAPCATCHSVEEGADHSLGPNLWGVYGAPAASKPGYEYSEALAASGLRWNTGELHRFLENPRATVQGTNMIYEGVTDEEERAAIIAYLRSLQ